MRKFRRIWRTFGGRFWVVCLAVVTVTVCVNHLPIEDVTHPQLCIDSSNPVVQRADSSRFFAEGGAFPLSDKSHRLVLSSGASGSHFILEPAFLSEQLPLTQSSLSATTLPNNHSVLLL